jgi:hypothetical protein
MIQEELTQNLQGIEPARLAYMDRQTELFEAAKPVLLEQYLNEYVAFEDGQVIDHDADRRKLAERIYAKYGYRDFLMKQVTKQERVYHVGGFRSMRNADT